MSTLGGFAGKDAPRCPMAASVLSDKSL